MKKLRRKEISCFIDNHSQLHGKSMGFILGGDNNGCYEDPDPTQINYDDNVDIPPDPPDPPPGGGEC